MKLTERFRELARTFDILFGRIVRATGLKWYQMVLDVTVFRVADNKCDRDERVL